MKPEQANGRGAETNGAAAETGEALVAVYDDMRRMAAAMLGWRRFSSTLPPTAIVHEACLRMMHVTWHADMNRSTVLALAARVMRSVLTDHARRRETLKRGGDCKRVALDGIVLAFEDRGYDLVELASALDRLGAADPRLVQIVELRMFGGWTLEEIAGLLHVSERTIRRDWTAARAWLRCEYGVEDDGDRAVEDL